MMTTGSVEGPPPPARWGSHLVAVVLVAAAAGGAYLAGTYRADRPEDTTAWVESASPRIDALTAALDNVAAAARSQDGYQVATACGTLARQAINARDLLPSPVPHVDEPLTAALDSLDRVGPLCVTGLAGHPTALTEAGVEMESAAAHLIVAAAAIDVHAPP